MRSRTGILTMMAAALVLAAGCASSGKLAKQSQEQLAGGDTRKAYETALRAVAKNPYDTSAQAALKASAQELLRHDGNRFRSLLAAADTTEAAEISLGMVAIRHTVARAGVTLVPDPQVAADERKVRHAVAMRAALEGHDRFQEGNPKEACYSYAEARRLEPEETQWAAAFEEARVAATDRVLLLPYACDTRAPIDSRVLSDDMLTSVTRFAEANLEFTELADPGDSWTRLSSGNGRAGRSVTHEAAVRMGQKNEATRVPGPAFTATASSRTRRPGRRCSTRGSPSPPWTERSRPGGFPCRCSCGWRTAGCRSRSSARSTRSPTIASSSAAPPTTGPACASSR